MVCVWVQVDSTAGTVAFSSRRPGRKPLWSSTSGQGMRSELEWSEEASQTKRALKYAVVSDRGKTPDGVFKAHLVRLRASAVLSKIWNSSPKTGALVGQGIMPGWLPSVSQTMRRAGLHRRSSEAGLNIMKTPTTDLETSSDEAFSISVRMWNLPPNVGTFWGQGIIPGCEPSGSQTNRGLDELLMKPIQPNGWPNNQDNIPRDLFLQTGEEVGSRSGSRARNESLIVVIGRRIAHKSSLKSSKDGRVT